ncbi:MAG: hypothetical protein EHM39_10090 [Chloroflexi bacterium]|nr:MAG: hypothetical protein EHM39_10090 [Chloroflexota bacterium]
MRENSINRQRQIRVMADGLTALDGFLNVPPHANGIVAFAHGSGSSRHSARNQFVAQALYDAGLGTLLFDLLTPEEEYHDSRTREYRFNIPLLAHRLAGAVDWLQAQPATRDFRIGLFGSSTGAAAALIAAAEKPDAIGAVVSRGGRPDLAGEMLALVHAPTLLIVGSQDIPVIGMNREAMRQMSADVRLEIVPGATHLFQEPGTLERVAELAQAWFVQHLSAT